MPLQLKFDPNQQYQLDAIQAVVDVFDGLPAFPSQTGLSFDVVPNVPPGYTLNEEWLRDNVSWVQEGNGIQSEGLLPRLTVDDGIVLDGAGVDSHRYPSFTIEMETGTGKTYVYLRTIHELRQRHGFHKFVIVVPSIAIYEGVVKNYQVTRSHFASLYGNETVDLIRYEGSRLSALRHFATSTSVSILVMTLASFNSKSNVIYRASEKLPGQRLPFQYIQETRPILILDEPQNMGTQRAKKALRALHPLFALRYSATHRETPNLVYRLTPFDAFRLNLVKMIRVDAVTERENWNLPYLALEEIARKGNRWTAQVRTRINDRGRTRESEIVLRQGDRLQAKTFREEHAEYVVSEIHAGEGYIEFENGQRLNLYERVGPSRTEVFRVQIEQTIQEHMARQEQLLDQGLKVLSLFFIDRVANYVDDDGIIKHLFDEAFDRIKTNYPHFAKLEAREVRDGYFAKRHVKGTKDEEEFVDTPIEEKDKKKPDREAEKVTFQLIMRDKERLLSLDEPVSFIFAHSALKEGWDNPNVFQICTLNQTRSEMKKRQEIGRGLRLAVNQDGERVFDEGVNVLTVVANESYDEYCQRLQTEYEDAGQDAPPKPTRAKRAPAQRNEALFQDQRFRNFWTRLTQLSRYEINIDAPTLIDLCVERLNNERKEFFKLKPVLVVERGGYVVTKFGLTLIGVTNKSAHMKITVDTTSGAHTEFDRPDFTVRDKLEKYCRDERLRDYQITSIVADDWSPRVEFGNGEKLNVGQTLSFQSQAGQVPVKRAKLAPEQTYPVFNLIDRAAKETGLTRSTLNTIFRQISPHRAGMIFKNPEGFSGWFTGIVRGALADHMMDKMTFSVPGGGKREELEKLFPPVKEFPQRELIEAGSAGLYDQVQVDSEVETRFVAHRVRSDDKVILYFKFPPSFRIPLPKIVGSYNPDWGILRWTEDNKMVLQLVRETKGAMDPRQLQFAHERRKVAAAKKHFHELGIDYRVVTDEIVDWWEEEEEQPEIGL